MDQLLHAATLTPPPPHPQAYVPSNLHTHHLTPPHSPATSSLSSLGSTPPTPPTPSSPCTPCSASPCSASPAHIAAARAAASEALLAAGTGASFDLAAAVVRSAPLAAAARRGARVLPGRSDTSVAAAYMLGGTPDAALAALLRGWDVSAPRAARVKAAEAAYKGRVRVMIAELNGGGGREGRAENLAALRVCEAIADVLDGHVVREMAAGIAARDDAIRRLTRQVAELQQAQQTPEAMRLR